MLEQSQLDAVFAALADPTRRAMLARLAEGEATVSELAEPFGLAQPTISKHLRVLEEAGLIQQGREAQRRPRTLVIGGPLKDVDVWLEPFRQQWERRFDSLDRFLQQEKQEKQEKPRTKRGKGERR
jgi:DNA-binding transcriptional ArsR family regulator